jgi:hypothetical protein
VVHGHLSGLLPKVGESACGVLDSGLLSDEKLDTFSNEVLIQHDAAVESQLLLESDSFLPLTLDRLQKCELSIQELLVLSSHLVQLPFIKRYLHLCRRLGCHALL